MRILFSMHLAIYVASFDFYPAQRCLCPFYKADDADRDHIIEIAHCCIFELCTQQQGADCARLEYFLAFSLITLFIQL